MARITLNAGTAIRYGSGTFIPLGTCGVSSGIGVLVSTSATNYVELDYLCERADAHGLGYAGSLAGCPFAELTIVQIA